MLPWSQIASRHPVHAREGSLTVPNSGHSKRHEEELSIAIHTTSQQLGYEVAMRLGFRDLSLTLSWAKFCAELVKYGKSRSYPTFVFL